MAKRWKCARCSTENDEGVITCSNCKMIRGGVVVPGTFSDPANAQASMSPASLQPPTIEPGTPPVASTSDDWSRIANPDADASHASRPLWRRLPLQWLLVGGLVAAGGIGGLLFNASRSSSGEINKAGDLGATELRAGDCFDLKNAAAEEIEDVAAKPCTDEHEYELFFVGDMADGSYPSEDAFDAYVESNCGAAFEAYVGKRYETSELEVSTLVPTAEAWNGGDHSVQCAVYHPNNPKLTESMKGSAR